MTAPHIVCIGNGVIDQIFNLASPLETGGKIDVRAYRESGGGPAATAAVTVCRLGGRASWIGRVGDDATGQSLLTLMSGYGVDVSHVSVLDKGRTTRAIVLVDPDGERVIVVDRSGLPAEAPVRLEALKGAQALLADTRWPAGAKMALAAAAVAKIPTVLDADGGAPDVLRELASKAQHVVFSDQGLSDVAGTGSPQDRLLSLTPLMANTVTAVTLGAVGSLWRIGATLTSIPALAVQARDTTGCGDVFHGAYTLAIAEGRPPLKAARFASIAAGLKAEHGQGWDGIPDRASVDAIVAKEQAA
ncbi:MAG: PfkB family carbohydrate kinase [Alphaproteobacteria bacterium]